MAEQVTFWDLVQRLKDETGTSERWILKQVDINHGAFSAWKRRGINNLPERKTLLLLARTLRVDYEYLLDVILHEMGYLPFEAALAAEIDAEEERRAARARLGAGDAAEVRRLIAAEDDDTPQEPGQAKTRA